MNSVTPGAFDERAYLSFLNSYVSPELPEKIYEYSDLNIDKMLTVDQFIEPLRSGTFPRHSLTDYHWILQEMLSSWPKATPDNCYDTVYVCSFYILSHLLIDAGPIDLIPLATALIVNACQDESLRKQCTGFLRWLMTLVHDIERRESNPNIFLLLSIIVMQSRSIYEMALATEKLFEEDKTKDPDARDVLERCVSDLAEKLWIDISTDVTGKSGKLDKTSRLVGDLLGQDRYGTNKQTE